MAKETRKSEVSSKEETKIENQDITLSNVMDMEIEEILNSYEEGMELSGNYKEFEIGETERFFVVGVTQMTAKSGDGDITAIKFLDKDGSVVVNADAVIRSTLAKIAEDVESGKLKPVPVQITCIGEKKSSKGEYKAFRITKLQ